MGFFDTIKAIGGEKKAEADSKDYSGGSESAEKDAEALFSKAPTEPDIEAGRSKVDLGSLFANKDVQYMSAKDEGQRSKDVEDVFSEGRGATKPEAATYFSETNKLGMAALGGAGEKMSKSFGDFGEGIRSKYAPTNIEKQENFQKAYEEEYSFDKERDDADRELRKKIKKDQQLRALGGRNTYDIKTAWDKNAQPLEKGALVQTGELASEIKTDLSKVGSGSIDIAARAVKGAPGKVNWAVRDIGATLVSPVSGAIAVRKGLGELKTQWNVAELGGTTKEKVKVMGMVPVRDKEGKVIMDDGKPRMKEGVVNYKDADMIIVPVKRGKTWGMEKMEATPQNIRMAVLMKRQKEDEVKLGQKYVEAKEAEVKGMQLANERREFYLNRAATTGTRGLEALGIDRSTGYSVRSGFTPRFNVGGVGESGYIRDRYQVGGIPGVARALQKGRGGLAEIHSRVLSNYSAPITPNPQLRMQLPNVFGAGTSLSPQGGNAIAALSVSPNMGGGAVLAKLQPNIGIKAGTPLSYGLVPTSPQERFGSSLSFGGMREMGSKILGGKKR